MEKYLNKWFFLEILYYKSNFQEINNLESVHPDDWDLVKNNLTNTFYECIGLDGEYLIVRSKKHTLRIKSDLIKRYLPSPKFKWGNRVIISAKNTEATIDSFFWHEKDQKYYYYLTVNEKKKSKWYSEDEMIKI